MPWRTLDRTWLRATCTEPTFDRAVICGAGAAGLVHALVLRSAGVRVVGVFDPDDARARELADLAGAEVYPDEKTLFDARAPIACIASPPPLHVSQAARAARDGRVVFVEKPLATTRADLQRLAEVPRCVPIVQWRAGRALRAVRAAIARGELGPSPTVNVDLAWSRDEAYFASGRASARVWGCGVLLSVGVHAVDAVVWALGRRVLSARSRVAHPHGVDVETRAVAHVELEGGALAAVRATFDAGPDATRLAFAGGGVTAVIEGGELDPTAGSVRWTCRDPERLERLHELEVGAGGTTSPPLLVPFLHAALAALERGAAPGACDALPSVADVEDAHRAIFDAYADARAAAVTDSD